MKYFKQELLGEDVDVYFADEAWSLAIREYGEYLKSISDGMSESLRNFSNICLHDAKMISINPSEQLEMVVQEEPPNETTWLLRFHDATYTNMPDKMLYWGYEEIEKVADGYKLTIMFGDLSEMEIRFSDLDLVPF